MTPLPPVCILAGGRGSRLGALVDSVPKPLIDVAGEPFLFHQLRLLESHGITRVVMCVGYLGEKIEQQVGKSRFGIEIDYSYDRPGVSGTLGAIRGAAPLLPERFLVLYGDTYLRLDYRAALAAWGASGRRALMTVLHNRGRWGRSNVVFENGRVTRYAKDAPREEPMEWIDYGLEGLHRDVLDIVGSEERELARLQSRLAELGELYGYEVRERFFEIGTPAALDETATFLQQQVGID